MLVDGVGRQYHQKNRKSMWYVSNRKRNNYSGNRAVEAQHNGNILRMAIKLTSEMTFVLNAEIAKS